MNWKMTSFSTNIDSESGLVTQYAASVQLVRTDGTADNVSAYITLTSEDGDLEEMTKRDIQTIAISKVKEMVNTEV